MTDETRRMLERERARLLAAMRPRIRRGPRYSPKGLAARSDAIKAQLYDIELTMRVCERLSHIEVD